MKVSYAQETGRAGRSGSQAVAYLLYNGILLNHVEWDMKSYVRNDMCRRTTILKHFDEDASPQLVLHLCCDYCASKCECGSSDCGTLTTYPSKVLRQEPESKLRSRGITSEQREAAHEKLTTYHKMHVDFKFGEHFCQNRIKNSNWHFISSWVLIARNTAGSHS